MSSDRSALEELLVQALLRGEWADFTQLPDFDIAQKPVVSALFLRNLLLGINPGIGTLPSGVRLRGAHVEGDLDLADCSAPNAAEFGVVALEDCDLPGRIDVSNTQLTRLSIRGSRFRELWGAGATIRGDVDFRETMPFPDPVEAIAYIRLRAARIGGDVWGRGASLTAPSYVPRGLTMVPPALQLWMAKIDGSGNFELGFKASGSLNFQGAIVGGSLDFRGARLSNPGGLALDAEGIQVGGEVRFSPDNENRFEADGEMSLLKARIGTDLRFHGARLSNAGGYALNASGCAVGKRADFGLYAAHRFEADGEMSLSKGQIGTDLDFSGARLSNAGGYALNASGCAVGGSAYLATIEEYRFEADGAIILWDATVYVDLDFSGARLRNPDRNALSADGIKVGKRATFGLYAAHRFEADGEMSLSKGQIGTDLDFSGARLSNAGGDALDASGCSIGGSAYLHTTEEYRFEADGAIILWDATVYVDLDFSGARLRHPDGYALSADGIKVGKLASFGSFRAQRFEAEGEVSLLKATIGTDLNFPGARLSNPGGLALRAAGIQIGGLGNFGESGANRFETEGEVFLWNAKIGTSLDLGGAKLNNTNGNALDATGCTIGGDALLCAIPEHRFEADGGMQLSATRIAGDLYLNGSRLNNAGGDALYASGCSVGGSAYLSTTKEYRFEADGKIDFSDATVARNLFLQGASFRSANGCDLRGDGCVVGATLHAHDNQFFGDVSFVDAKVEKLGSFSKSAWQGAKTIRLESITIRHIAVENVDGTAWKARRDWLRASSFRDNNQPLTVSPHPWKEVATAFARSGRHADARRVQRAGYQEENRARPTWIRPFVWFFAELPFGYGLSVLRATITILSFWLVGTLGAETMHARNALIDSSEPQLGSQCKSIIPALYALDTAIPILDLREEMKCGPGDIGQHGLFRGFELKFPLRSEFDVAGRADAHSMHVLDEITLWTWAKAIYAVFGALIVSFALITYSGVFKPRE